MIDRILINRIQSRLNDNKTIILLGPRQVGKTTFLHSMIGEENLSKTLWLSGDEPDIRNTFSSISSTQLKQLIGIAHTVVIDEAQRIPNIGVTIKLITDQLKGIKVIATGSSALELANNINEPLTGRKWEFTMFPLSTEELCKHYGVLNEKRMLSHRLVYGNYPEIVTNPGSEQERLIQLANNYLYKDVLSIDRVLKPEKLERLLQALALQMGNEISYHELALLIGLDSETVEKYIRLLEKTFIIFRLHSLSRNLRNELKKSRKVYFYDNGIRNAVINQFQPIALRQDIGALWENFMVSERMKYLHYNGISVNRYFWRTHAQQEIDYLEEKDGKFNAFEFKWNTHRKAKFSKSFTAAYEVDNLNVVTPENYCDFLIPQTN